MYVFQSKQNNERKFKFQNKLWVWVIKRNSFPQNANRDYKWINQRKVCICIGFVFLTNCIAHAHTHGKCMLMVLVTKIVYILTSNCLAPPPSSTTMLLTKSNKLCLDIRLFWNFQFKTLPVTKYQFVSHRFNFQTR